MRLEAAALLLIILSVPFNRAQREDADPDPNSGVQYAGRQHQEVDWDTHHQRYLHAPHQLSDLPQLIACALVKNELPYLIEWVEYHHLMGFKKLVIYDDNSEDSTPHLQRLYRQLGKDYLDVHHGEVWQPPIEDQDPAKQGDTGGRQIFDRQGVAGQLCVDQYSSAADWLVMLDIDEFMFPAYHVNVPMYFHKLVEPTIGAVLVGATRFGANGQLDRFAYHLEAIHEGGEGNSTRMRLSNPHGVQLVTATHTLRAPDMHFGEPEAQLRDLNERCRGADPVWPLCTNDYDGRAVKTFVRTARLYSLWEHGGRLKVEGGELRVISGHKIKLRNDTGEHAVDCELPDCMRTDPLELHIHHLRAPSLADAMAKRLGTWNRNITDEELREQRMGFGDFEYVQSGQMEKDTLLDQEFFNTIRDTSMVRFHHTLSGRIGELMGVQF